MQSNYHQSSTDSRTYHPLPACSPHPALSFWFLCTSNRRRSLLSSPLPSNSDQSEDFYTAAGTSSQTSLGDQHTCAPRPQLSLFFCHWTDEAFCVLWLGPASNHRHLKRTKQQDLILKWQNSMHYVMSLQFLIFFLIHFQKVCWKELCNGRHFKGEKKTVFNW